MGPVSLRDRYNAFIAGHEVAWELTFAGLAILYVAAGFLGDEASPEARPLIDALDWGLTAGFVAEFATRIMATRDRRAYLRGHWIDLAALVPAVRGLRVLRLLRLLRLVRAFAGIARALTSVERLAGHKGLVWLLVAWIGVMLLCSLAYYTAEHGVNPAVKEPIDALWWGVVTMTTVGYGDTYPQTVEGRLAASVLMILGIGLYSAVTATVTSFVLTGDRPATDAAARLRALDALRDEGRLSTDEYERKRAKLLDLL
jgi:voltage-gated potassium channel